VTPHQHALINTYAMRWRQCVLDMGYSEIEWQRVLHDPIWKTLRCMTTT
jgi:hypothetical protein